MKILNLNPKIVLLLFLFSTNSKAQNKWSWMGGYLASDAIWSTPRPNPSPLNIKGSSWVLGSNFKPSVREHCGGGIANNNEMYMYGGASLEDSYASDFWIYDISQQKWAFISDEGWNISRGPQGVEAPNFHPGGMNRMASAVDKDGNLWMFGGLYLNNRPNGNEINLSDLWKYNRKTSRWTFYGNRDGTNLEVPAARHRARAWFDTSNNLWLYGGAIGNQSYNDLWMFNTTTSTWLYISGNKNITYGPQNDNGVYPSSPGISGTQYYPRARSDYAYWIDNTGNFWIYGGYVVSHGSNEFGDLWKFEPSTKKWTLVNGANVFDPPISNTNPGSRNAPYCWVGNDNKLYMFGGGKLYSHLMADCWRMNTATSTWELVRAAAENSPPISTGFQVENATNLPGTQVCTLNHITTGSHTYMFNGYGLGSNATGDYSDGSKPHHGYTAAVWRYSLDGYSPSKVPIANNDLLLTPFKSNIYYSILNNDTPKGSVKYKTIDLDITKAGVQDTLSTASGVFSIDTVGVVKFKPITGFLGTSTVNYTYQNSENYVSNTARLDITVSNTGPYPNAKDDKLTSPYKNVLRYDILANDISTGDINLKSIDIDTTRTGKQDILVTPSGTFNVDTLGIVKFNPLSSTMNGEVRLGYSFQDQQGRLSNTAKFSLTVYPIGVNNSLFPIANDDKLKTIWNAAIYTTILENDIPKGQINYKSIDIDLVQNGIQKTMNLASGVFIIDSLGNVRFNPVSTFTGISNLEYTFQNIDGYISNTGKLIITVYPSSSLGVFPVANGDYLRIIKKDSIYLSVIINDLPNGLVNYNKIDIDSSLVGTQNILSTIKGIFSIDLMGNLLFRPAIGFVGTAKLTYSFQNTDHFISNRATVTFDIYECSTNNIILTAPQDNLSEGQYLYKTNGKIVANNKINQNQLALKVEMNAVASVSFLPGFEINITKESSNFKAQIGGCN